MITLLADSSSSRLWHCGHTVMSQVTDKLTDIASEWRQVLHTPQWHDLISRLNYQHVYQCHDSITSTCVSVKNPLQYATDKQTHFSNDYDKSNLKSAICDNELLCEYHVSQPRAWRSQRWSSLQHSSTKLTLILWYYWTVRSPVASDALCAKVASRLHFLTRSSAIAERPRCSLFKLW